VKISYNYFKVIYYKSIVQDMLEGFKERLMFQNCIA